MAKKVLPPHMERVEKERDELQEKVDKLQEFVNSTNLSKATEEEQKLLLLQLHAMKKYVHILEERLMLYY